MGFVSNFFQKRSATETNMIALLRAGLNGAGGTASGVRVTSDNAMQVMAVYACVKILAESLASLPFVMYEQNGKAKQRATGHSLYPILHDLPNPEMTSLELRETLMGHLALRGNAYANKVFDGAGRIIELWPLRPDKTEVKRSATGELYYEYTLPSGEKRYLMAYEVMHIRGLSPDGLMGYNPIALARQAVGLAMATEEFGARFFGNGAKATTVLKHPGKLSDKAFDRLTASWNERHQGLENAHRMAILEEGMDIVQVSIAPEDAQFLQTRKFQKSEIAGLYRIPPHMIADLEHATFGNIEHQSLEFVTYTLFPWLVRWEQAAYRDLLTPEERKRYFVRFQVNALLRGDIASRYTAYATAHNNGWMSANEIRELEDMNPYDGGDAYLMPLNMVPVDQVGQQPVAQRSFNHVDGLPKCRCADCLAQRGAIEHRADDSTEPDKHYVSKAELIRSYIPLFNDVAGRVVRREVNDVRRAVEKHLRKRSAEDFKTWLDGFYKDFPGVVRDNFEAMFLTYAAAMAKEVAHELGKDNQGVTEDLRKFIREYLDNMGLAHAASSRHQLEALLDEAPLTGDDPAQVVGERLDSWEETRPTDMADHQSFEAGNALSIAIYASSGIKFLRWVTSGSSCPFCQRLNGKIAGIAEFFVYSGDSLDDGNGGSMTVRRDTRHGPLHRGCDCCVLAG